MRHLYTGLFYALVPFLYLRLLIKGRKQPGYLQRISERFGYYAKASLSPSIRPLWIHAVSVGECEAVFPLVKRLLSHADCPPLLMTCTTPTGSQRIQEVLGSRVLHVYLPYDLPVAVAGFLRHFNPRAGVIVETEIWPNLFYGCKQKEIPLAIINGRLSLNSLKGYQRLGRVMHDILAAVRILATQTQEDADRYLAAGAPPERLRVAGNIKFDIAFDEAMEEEALHLRAALFGQRPVWIAGSTHPGEEAILLEAHRAIRVQHPEAVLVLAPRHPERAQEVVSLIAQQGESVTLRSEGTPLKATDSVFLIDGVGELKRFYGAADVAFLGGSLIPHGGQNPLEAQIAGRPVLFGPFMMNFKSIARTILEEQTGREVSDAQELATQVLMLLDHPADARAMGERGRAFVKANQGALDRIESLITRDLMA